MDFNGRVKLFLLIFAITTFKILGLSVQWFTSL